MIVFVSSLEGDAHEVGPWHFRIFLLLLAIATPPLITLVEAKETFYKGILVDIGTWCEYNNL